MGSMLEASHLGFWRMAAFYFLSGFGGITFSILVSNTKSVGASTSIFGITGYFIVYLVVMWD